MAAAHWPPSEPANNRFGIKREDTATAAARSRRTASVLCQCATNDSIQIVKRREFIALVGGALGAWPFTTEVQGAEKLWRLPVVIVGSSETSGYVATPFAQRLAEKGYNESHNVKLTNHFVAPQPNSLEQVLSTVSSESDLLVVWSTVGAVAAKQFASNLRAVCLAVGDPINTGLVQSLARPGGNMTGVTYEAAAETWVKRVQILNEILPDLKRVAVLKAAGDPYSGYAMTLLQPWGPKLGVTFLPIEFGSAEGLEPAFEEMNRSQVGALLVIGGSLQYVNRKQIADLALSHHLPSCHNFRETVEAGGLVSLSPNFTEIARIGAEIAAKIMDGSNPSEIPVQQPTQYQVHVNLKTARSLGLIIPPALLARADKLIE